MNTKISDGLKVPKTTFGETSVLQTALSVARSEGSVMDTVPVSCVMSVSARMWQFGNLWVILLLNYTLLDSATLYEDERALLLGSVSSLAKCGELHGVQNKVNCSDVEWTGVIYVMWFYFEVKWSDVKWVTVKFLGMKVPSDLILRVLDYIVTI